VASSNKNSLEFFYKYFSTISSAIAEIDVAKLNEAANIFLKASNTGGKIIFIGNGGSAAMSSHLSIDLTKAANIRAINFNEADLLTCFANDYGYEHWVDF
jgi:D-sedoheptulose 7-phosphate isomerase